MGNIEAPKITTIDARQCEAVWPLSVEAGWNQNVADWRFMLGAGRGFGCRGADGKWQASSLVLPLGQKLAWISMVLVTESWRRRGLATRLVDTCLNTATKLGLTAWLDATPAGSAVYGPLGFTPTIQLRRLRIENASSSAAPPSAGKIDEFITCDINAMGFDRSELLQELGGRPASRLVSSGDAIALVRDGRAARHIGPVFATTPAHALALVRDIVASEQGAILIDAVANQNQFLNGLTDAGWIIDRPFQRMRFGRATTQGAELPFAVVGPEFG